MKKQIFFLFLFFILISSVYGVQNPVIYNETWKTGNFFLNSSDCNNMGLGATTFNITENLFTAKNISAVHLWKCGNARGTFNDFNLTQNNQTYYTPNSLNLKWGICTGGGGNNCAIYLYNKLDSNTDYFLNNNTLIRYTGEVTDDYQGYLIFLDNLGQSILGLEIIDGDETANPSTSVIPNISQACGYNSSYMIAKTWKNTSFYLKNLTYCTYLNNEENKIFNTRVYAVALGFVRNGNTVGNIFNFTLDDINITFFNGSNAIPTFNVTTQNYSYCLNNDTITIPVNITVFDAENDTIYYATTTQTTQQTVKQVNFYKKVCILGLVCNYFPDYSQYTELTTGCHIDDTINYNSTVYNNLVPRNNAFNQEIWMLELNPNCNPQTFYNHINALSGLYSSFIVWDLENLNISFYRQDGFQFLNIYLIHNGSNVDMWINGTIRDTLTYTSRLSLARYSEQNAITLQLSNSTKPGNTINLTATPFNEIVSYIGLSGNAKIERFSYSGSILNPDFTTTAPTEMVLSTLGYNFLTFYVTDNYHLSTNYTQYILPVYVYESENCKYAQGQGIGKGLTPVADVDVLGSLKSFFGKSLKSYLVDMGYYDTGEKLLWFVWVILFLILLITFSFALGGLNAAIPFFISSVAVGFIAFMVDYTTVFVTMLIFIAFGLAVPFASMFLGGDK